jgi:serine/threonine protein kinase
MNAVKLQYRHRDHPNIHKILGICEYNKTTYVISELRLGNLKDFLRHQQNRSLNLYKYCAQIANVILNIVNRMLGF